jgi:hypothetical protein
MPFLFRLIAVLLMLTSGGVVQTLAFASGGDVNCAGEQDEGPCTDCTLDCGLCLCCPLRAAPALSLVQTQEAPVREEALSAIGEPVLAGPGEDIFQPPRA